MGNKALIKGCIANDRNAQHELFSRYRDTLFFISLKYCRNAGDAEDNVHDAFIAIFQKIHTYKNKGSFEGWMKRITIFKAIDKYKQQVRTTELDQNIPEEKVYLQTEPSLSIEQLLQMVQQLPDQYRLVFNLYQLDGFSHKEIAALLEISENTSKSNYHRAKILLRKKIMALESAPDKKMNPWKKNAK